ncbi:MAG: SDR family oxidoreductase, partial [Acidobacteriota bacterium]
MDPKTSTDVRDKVVLVTGGGSGIGRAVCRAFAQAGARGVAVADVDADAARSVADGIGGLAIEVDMGDEADVQRMIARTRDTYGPIDIFCSNAGILSVGGIEASNEEWQRAWQVNFMAHVYAARDLVPEMLERGGAFVLVASAAGLLTQVGAAPYAVTKHATVAIAEWLAMTYGHRGLQVACVCPLGVRTPKRLDHHDQSPHA